MSIRRGYGICLAFCVALLGAFLLYRLLAPREETPEEVAKKCVEYFEARNARGLLRYAMDVERDLLELDEEKIRTLLDRVWESLEGFAPQGEIKVESYGDGSAVAFRVYTHPDGRESSFRLVVHPTEKGQRSVDLVFSLVGAFLAAGVPKEQRNADAVELFASVLHHRLPDLNRLPVRGVVLFRADYTFQMLTWSEWANEWTERWRKKRRQEVEAIYQKKG